MDGPTVRNLLRRATTATLATHDAATGHPYASLVEVATMPDARPVLLLSGLARHTRNLKADARASLLVDQRSVASPLAAERAALIGNVQPTHDPMARRRYLARYPEAEPWAQFGDFGYWTLDISGAHVIAGFGRIGEVPGNVVQLGDQAVEKLSAQEAELLASVNAERAVAATAYLVTAVDCEGFDWEHAGKPGRCACDLSPGDAKNVVLARLWDVAQAGPQAGG